MGFWKTERGIGGDSWADEVDRAQANLASDKVKDTKEYSEENHEITIAEYADLIEFCSRGHLVVEVREQADGNLPLSQLHDNGIKTYDNRGQIHCTELNAV